MKNKIIVIITVLFVTLSLQIIVNAESLSDRLKGTIILQVEENGEAWYINPNAWNNRVCQNCPTPKLHYLGRPNDAFKIMRSQGLGINNKDLAKIKIGNLNLSGVPDQDGDGISDYIEEIIGSDFQNTDSDGDGYNDLDEIKNGYDPLRKENENINEEFSDSLLGMILLQTEANGEAWYVNPSDKKRYFLGKPSSAYNIMRELGLGVSEDSFAQLKIEDTLGDFGAVGETEIIYELDSKIDLELPISKMRVIDKAPDVENNSIVWVEREWLSNNTLNYASLEKNEKLLEKYYMDYKNKKLFVLSSDNIKLKNLDTGEIKTIASREFEVFNISLSPNFIIWEEFEEVVFKPNNIKMNKGIYAYNLQTEEIKQIVSNSKNEITEPSLSGTKIVYWDKTKWIAPGSKKLSHHAGDIYLYDLENDTETKLTEEGENYQAVISGDNIAWFNSDDVYYMNLRDKTIEQVTNDNGNRNELAISNKYIAWDNYGDSWQKVYGYGTIQGLEYYSIINQSINKLTLNEDGSNKIQRSPIINGGYIVYDGGPESFKYSTFIFDIENKTNIQINKESYKVNADNGNVVWQKLYSDNKYVVFRHSYK